MGKVNMTDETLNQISAAAHALHSAAADLWLRWKIQGDKYPLNDGAFAVIGRFIDGFNGIKIGHPQGLPGPLPGASMHVKLQVIERAEDIFQLYARKAKQFWADVERLLPSCGTVAERAYAAAEGQGPQR